MEINTILIIGNMIISALTVCQRSRCTDIEISDCIKIRRDVPDDDELLLPLYTGRIEF
jgi:hypothetical protein